MTRRSEKETVINKESLSCCLDSLKMAATCRVRLSRALTVAKQHWALDPHSLSPQNQFCGGPDGKESR